MNQQPDWSQLEADVVLRIRLLAAAWAGTAGKPLHDQMVRDLYLPCVRLLAEFRIAVEVEE